MAIPPGRRWDPTGLIRVGADRDRDPPDLYDPEIIGAVWARSASVVDYLRPKKPPPGARWSQMRQEAARVWPRDDGGSSPHRRARGPLKRYWEACQALKRAGEQDFIQAIAPAAGGDAKGIDRGQGASGVINGPARAA